MSFSRRHFILQSAGAAALPALAQSRAANDKVQFATIGIGGMGFGDTASAVATPGTQFVAAADIYQGRLDRAKEIYGNSLFTTRDYKEILARKDIDAVIVATPDHWHAQIAIEAMEAGKDVYVEKPMVQQPADGLKVVAAAKKTGRILQVGSQRVSSIVYEKARDLFRSGAIGELNLVEANWDRNSAIGAWQYSIPTDASPQTVDWDRFLGAAPKRPFEPIRLFRWRNYQDYGTGVAGDLFVHLFSGLHHILGAIGPDRIFASGGLRFWKDGRDVPDIMMGLYDYSKTLNHPAFNLCLRVNFVNGSGETSGFRFVGSEGIMTVGSNVTLTKQPPETEPGTSIGTFAKATQEQFMKQYRLKHPARKASAATMKAVREEVYSPPPGYSDHRDHHANFFSAVRTRTPVVEDALFGIRAAGPALASNASYFSGKILAWDPSKAELKG